MDKLDDVVEARLARKFYEKYCEAAGKKAYRDPYVPPWALDYAAVAVEMLGYDAAELQALGIGVPA
jgi:hypothetical protein